MGNSKYFLVDCTLNPGVTKEQLDEALTDCRAHRVLIGEMAYYDETKKWYHQPQMFITFFTTSMSGSADPLLKLMHRMFVIRTDIDFTDVHVTDYMDDGETEMTYYTPKEVQELPKWKE